MSLLNSLKAEDGVKIESEKDSLGGGFTIDSGAYPGKIGMAYLQIADSEAMGLNITFVTEGGKEVKETFWMTSGKAKGKKTYYTKDGTNYPLPGYSQANSLALLITGKEIGDLESEEKVVKVYNTEAKAEVPTKVQVLTELVGQPVIAGIVKQTVNKTKKNEAGVHENLADTKDENTFDKFFCAREGHENMTTTELKANATEAAFYPEWVKKNTGVTRDRVKAGGAASGTPGTPSSTGTPKPKQSLFGNKS